MSQESEKGSLPFGWVARISSKYPDTVYYFNTLTGNSTWECPKLVPRRLSNEKQEKASSNKLTQKRSSDCQTNIVDSHSASISNTPEERLLYKETPHVNMNKNMSKKRSLDIDTPTTSRSIHSPEELSSVHKPCPVNLHQNKPKERRLETDDPSTSKTDITKSSRIPTAIVAPVIAGEEKTSSQSVKAKRRRNRKRTNSKQKGNFVPKAVAQPLPVKEASQVPKNEQKRLRISPPVRKGLDTDLNKCSFNASTSYETRSTDSEMELEFGASSNAVSSTPKEITSPQLHEYSSWTEVEMLDVSADLTSLDEILPSRDSSQLNSHYIVVDTNVLIHDITHIEEIKETPLQGCGPPHIVIPWVVVQELDRLKCYNDAPGKLAQKAVRYLHKILKSKHPRFHGQSGEEAHKLKREYHDSNDDKIIDLCLNMRKKMNPEKVILLTNDKNLANKAMIYEIIVHDWTSLLKDIKPDIPIQASPKKKKPRQKFKNESVSAIMSKEHMKLVNEHSAYEKDIDVIMTESRQLLKEALDPFLVAEMQKAYGPTWERFQIDRRLLREILAAYIKFWPTVFYSHFTTKVKNSFELLHQKAISPKGFNGTYEECLMVLHAIEDIFRALVKVQPNMSSLINNIQSLQESYSHVYSKYSSAESSICELENAIKASQENLVLEILNHNWTVINEICGMVMDFYGIQHNFEYPKPVTIPPESEYRRVVADLYPSLTQLQQLMKKMIEHVINSTPSKPTFIKFVNGLKQLIPSLNLQSVTPNMTNLTPKLMEQFCRDPGNRQKIEVGYQQLDHFCKKLKEAIQSMISFKKNRPSTS